LTDQVEWRFEYRIFERGDASLTAYEFYREDRDGRPHFFGVLPERRKKPERIAQESITNWGRIVMGKKEGIRKIFFVKLEEWVASHALSFLRSATVS
jgi:hypothetical protein